MLTQEEKVLVHVLKSKEVAVATVEGLYNEERAVFLALVDQDEATGKMDITPVAMILRDEDIKLVSRPPEDEEEAEAQKSASRIIV